LQVLPIVIICYSIILNQYQGKDGASICHCYLIYGMREGYLWAAVGILISLFVCSRFRPASAAARAR